MKNTMKILGIIALIMITAFTITGCPEPNTNVSGGNDNSGGNNSGGNINGGSTGSLEFTLISDGTAYSVKAANQQVSGAVVIPAVYNSKPVTEIEDYAFTNCINVSSISAPDSITYIGTMAFYNTAWYNDLPDGLVYVGRILYQWKGDMPANTVINNIRPDTLIIYGVAFYGQKNLAGITIPDSVKSIGESAFSGCEILTSITIPNNVTSISSYAFSGCVNLSNIIIPNSIEYIGSGAFNNTAWLFNQPDGLIYAGKILYQWKGNMPANTVINNIRLDTVMIAENAFNYGSDYINNRDSLTGITIPGSIKTIGNNAFNQNKKLANITIQYGVQTIGERAFYNCSNLNNVVLPDSVTVVESLAFYFCSNLTNITLSNNLTAIPGSLFSMCYNLKSLTIPASVKSIGGSVFFSDTSMGSSYGVTSVTFNGTINEDNISTGAFPGDLRAKYRVGGPGTYTRDNGISATWVKQ